jgi:hypothetical protein
VSIFRNAVFAALRIFCGGGTGTCFYACGASDRISVLLNTI